MLESTSPCNLGTVKNWAQCQPVLLSVSAGFYSPLQKKESDSLRRHLHGQWTLAVTSCITCQGNMLAPNVQKWKQKPSLPDQSSLTIGLWWMPERFWIFWQKCRLFSRWESAYIGFMQTFPCLVCSHPFAVKQFSVISISLHNSEFKILPSPKIRGVSITALSEMKEVEASLTV